MFILLVRLLLWYYILSPERTPRKLPISKFSSFQEKEKTGEWSRNFAWWHVIPLFMYLSKWWKWYFTVAVDKAWVTSFACKKNEKKSGTVSDTPKLFEICQVRKRNFGSNGNCIQKAIKPLLLSCSMISNLKRIKIAQIYLNSKVTPPLRCLHRDWKFSPEFFSTQLKFAKCSKWSWFCKLIG